MFLDLEVHVRIQLQASSIRVTGPYHGGEVDSGIDIWRRRKEEREKTSREERRRQRKLKKKGIINKKDKGGKRERVENGR